MKSILKNSVCLLSFLFFIGIAAYGQENNITGVVSSDTGEALPGVAVVIKGTTIGTITNIDGVYFINAEEGDVLSINYLGYQSQEETVGVRTTINFVLHEDLIALDEVVAIGYGTSKKKDLTSAISSVNGEDMKTMSVSNPAQALQGKTPGVQIVADGGAPGKAPKVLIRGFTSINLDNAPLYVVDGIPMGDNLNFLNTNEIERIDVLKDASASAIYGSRASNGVILITTKKGKEGVTSFSADLSYGLQVFNEPYDMADATEYAQIMNQSLNNAGLDDKFDDPASLGKGTDWWGEGVNKVSPQRNFSFQANGGTEKYTYAVSLSYYDQDSFYNSGDWKRITGRINLNWKFSDKISAGIMVNPRREVWDNTPDWYQDYMLIDPITPIYRPEAEQEGLNEYSVYQRSLHTQVWNPIARDARQFADGGYYAAASNLFVTYKPIKNLEIKSQISGDYKFDHTGNFIPDYTIDPSLERNPVNKVEREQKISGYWNWTNTATYSITKEDHHIKVMGGTTIEKWDYQNIKASKEKTANNSDLLRELHAGTQNPTADGNQSGNSLQSFLGRVSYNYAGRYYLTATYRIDGSSKFLDKNKWASFPSASVAWRISDESFMDGLSFLDDMKFRFGWGRLGNQGIEDAMYLSTLSKSYYVYGNDGSLANTTEPSRVKNEDLKWETVEDINIGTDFTLLNGKWTGSVEYYQKKSMDMLFETPFPYYSGYGNYAKIWTNIGSMKSSGWEFAINYRNQAGDFKYDIGITAMTGQVEMTKLSNTAPVVYGKENRTKTVVGDEPGYYYGYKTNGLFQNQYEVNAHSNEYGELLQPKAQSGDIRFVDTNGDGKLTGDDRVKLGSPWPDFTAGLNVNLSYKGFDFLANIYASVGNELVNDIKGDLYGTTSAQHNVKSGLLNEAWHGEGTSNDIPRVSFTDNNENFTKFSDFFVEDGSFMRLKNIQLGYTIPKATSEKIGLSRCRVYVSGQNLVTVTKYGGVEPEVGGKALETGFGGWTYPVLPTYLVGININF